MNHFSLSPLLAFGKDWWLPANYSKHGADVDMLFYWIFWITMIIFVLSEAVLVVFLIQYRGRSDKKKAKFTHGNTRLEMAWTIAPSIILAILALASKRVWDNFRYSPDMDDPGRAKVLVIGEQFKWNIIYPGPDGKFGRYLLFPRPTDVAWPIGANGKPVTFDGVPGPASLPYEKALASIAKYIDTENKLGKDFTDPDGADDDYQAALSRAMFVPVNRPVEIQISSKDVIHDFFLPNFRAQLYAVPGMRGRFVFTPTSEASVPGKCNVDDLPSLMAQGDLVVEVDQSMAGDPHVVKDKFGWRFANIKNPAKPTTVVRDNATLDAAAVQRLKDAGITQIYAYRTYDIACAQICGLGHYSMKGQIIVLPQEQFDSKFPTAPHVPTKTAMAAAK